MLGKPLQTSEMAHQTISKGIGLAVFASDALSSMAYSTQEMMLVLAVAGTTAFSYIVPITIAIVLLLVILTLSYEQTIHAYPGGGGAYIVARDNLGDGPAMTAAAALLTDYILTVAVSISSGVAQFTSVFPELYPHLVVLHFVHKELSTEVIFEGDVLNVATLEKAGIKEMDVLLKLGKGNFSFVREVIPSGAKAIGSALKDLDLQCVIAAILRDGEVIPPHGDTVFMENDEVIALADRDGMTHLANLFSSI